MTKKKIPMKLACTISFHVARSSDGDTPTIVLVDKASRCTILEATLSMEDYAKGVLTSCHSVPCIVEYYGDKFLGKKREGKDEIIWVPHDKDRKKSKEKIRLAIIKPFEKNGWSLWSEDDLFNIHRWVRPQPPPPEGCSPNDGMWTRVSFVRWVDSEEN